jgi:hypothetical protein
MEYRHGITDVQQTSSNLAPATNRMGFTATVGGGSLEVTSGHGMTQSRGIEYTNAPQADTATGLVFSTEAGSPVPAGGPRPIDMVEIGGMRVKVAQAVRDGLIPDPSRIAPAQPQIAPQNAFQGVPQGYPQQAPEVAPESAADTFTNEVLPRVSPATSNSIEADLMEGTFSEKTLDYLQLEGGMNAAGLEGVRDAYAAKITAATGMDEGELEDMYNQDRAGFAKAVSEMMKTGSTTAFQNLAAQADSAAWTALDTDEAAAAWGAPLTSLRLF